MISNQSSVPMAYKEFDEGGRMRPSAYYDRVVDVMGGEMFEFTLLLCGRADYLTYRYSERVDFVLCVTFSNGSGRAIVKCGFLLTHSSMKLKPAVTPAERAKQFKTFRLRSPRDLLAKLKWDIEQLETYLEADTGYQYQALNCAMTAWSMCDWIYVALGASIKEEFPTETKFRDHMKAKSNWLKICRELADASKHCHLTDRPIEGVGTLEIEIAFRSSRDMVTQTLIVDGSTVHSAEAVMRGAYDFWLEQFDAMGL